VHSIGHALLKAFPERIRCDRDEISGLYEAGEKSAPSTVYVYDDFPGGLGLAEEFCTEPLSYLEEALEIIERCTCDDDEGCPVCLSHFGCPHFNANLSKFGGRYLLRKLLDLSTDPVIRDLEDYVFKVIPSSRIISCPPPSQAHARYSSSPFEDEIPF
jgi:DEAD/DEAH box helicase domain-containing protein